MPLADPYLLGPAYAANGKGSITALNLLLHNAGYPPDPVPNYNLVEVRGRGVDLTLMSRTHNFVCIAVNCMSVAFCV
jgi:hypothetical protein